MKYKALYQFCGGYLHEDWDADYDDDWTGAMRDFAKEPYAPDLRREVVQILSTGPSEEALEQLVRGYLRPNLAIDEIAGSYRDWLLMVADAVDDELRRLGRLD